MASLFLLLLPLASAQDPIPVDIPSTHSILQPDSSTFLFQISSKQAYRQDFLVLLSYNDQFPPHLSLSSSELPSNESNNTWEGVEWGKDTVMLLCMGMRRYLYYAWVSCEGPCAYNVSFEYVDWSKNWRQSLFASHADKGEIVALSYESSFDPRQHLQENLTFSVSAYNPDAQYLAAVISYPTVCLDLIKSREYHCEFVNKQQGTSYKVLLMAGSDLDYVVAVQTTGEPLELQANVLVQGTTEAECFHYYQAKLRPHAKYPDRLQVQLTVLDGEPSLYLQFDSPPTLSDFYFSPGISNHTILLASWHMTKEDFFIGVYSQVQAAYTLYFSLYQSPAVPLYPSLPQSGLLQGNSPSLYVASINSHSCKYAVFHVQATAGSTQLYVQSCPSANCRFHEDAYEHPEYFNVLHSHFLAGDNYITVPINAQVCSGARCVFNVAITSGNVTANANFTLSMDCSELPHHNILVTDIPVLMTLQQDYIYCQYMSSNSRVDTITFQVTPISGPVSLHLSRKTAWPSPSDYEKASKGVIMYERGKDGLTLSGTYYVAVSSETQTTFELVVYETFSDHIDSTRLYPEELKEGIVYEHNPDRPESDSKLYTLDIHLESNQRPTVLISLTPLSGTFLICVSNSTDIWPYDIGQYQLCTQKSPVYFDSSDLYYSYLVLVKGLEFASDHSASFLLKYSLQVPIICLQDNSSYTNTISKDSDQYYSFSLASDIKQVNVYLTPITAKPEIYLYFSSTETRPGRDHHQLSCTESAFCQFSIQREEILYLCSASSLQQNFKCSCYIGVHTYQPTTYSLKVTSVTTTTPLSLDTPTSGSAKDYVYYQTVVRRSGEIAACLQFLEGEADLVANLIDYAEKGNRWILPQKEKSDYRSETGSFISMCGANHNNFISISPDELQENCHSGTCVLITGIYCITNSCSYSLIIFQSPVLPILEGVTVFGSGLTGTYDYYKFHNEKSSRFAITLTTTCILSIYVNTERRSLPTAESNTWQTTLNCTGQMLIHPSDPVFADTGSIVGNFLIGIQSNCEYKLKVTIWFISVKKLEEGVSVQGETQASGAQYFMYSNSRNADVTISLKPLFCSAQLHINILHTTNLSDSLPSRDSSTWNSSTSENEQHLVISLTHPLFHTDSVFLVGVFAEQAECSFLLTASSGVEAQVLRNGVPTISEVLQYVWSYYVFSLQSYSDLHISVINYSGDVDVYVSTQSYVNVSTALWKKSTVNRVAHILISQFDSNMVVGEYSIGVSGNRNSTYSITAHVRGSYITLLESWPLGYGFLQSSEEYVKFKYEGNYSNCEAALCHLRRQEIDFWPEITIEFESFRSFDSYDSAPISFDRKDYDLYGVLTFSLPILTEGSSLLVVHRISSVGTFELSCSCSNPALLLAGRTEYGVLSTVLPRQQYQLYVSGAGLLQVAAVPCTGRISMSVMHGDHSEVSFTVSGEMIQTEIRNGLGLYYLTINLLKDATEARFQLSYDFYPQNIHRPDKIVPGNGGQLLWKNMDFNSILLTWTRPHYEDGSPFIGAIVYRVELTNNTHISMDTVCSLQAAIESGTAWVVLSDYTNETSAVVTLETEQVHIINVVSTIMTNTEAIHLSYIPAEVRLPTSAQKYSSKVLIIVIGLALALLALLALSIYWWKCRLPLETQGICRATLYADILESGSVQTSKRVEMHQAFELDAA